MSPHAQVQASARTISGLTTISTNRSTAPAPARNEPASRAARSIRLMPPFLTAAACCDVSVNAIRERLASRSVALFDPVTLASSCFAASRCSSSRSRTSAGSDELFSVSPIRAIWTFSWTIRRRCVCTTWSRSRIERCCAVTVPSFASRKYASSTRATGMRSTRSDCPVPPRSIRRPTRRSHRTSGRAVSPRLCGRAACRHP